MLTTGRLALAEELDRLVTLLPRLTPRRGLSLVAGGCWPSWNVAARGGSPSSPWPKASPSLMTGLVDR